jgi:flagellar hook-length control protein FliK
MHVPTASNAAAPARLPSATPSAEGAAGGDGAFAQLLASQPEPETEAPAEAASGATSGARPDEARAAKARQVSGRPTNAKPAQSEVKPAGAKDSVEARDGLGEDEIKDDAQPAAVDPALAQWLAQLQRPQAEAEAGAFARAPGHAHGRGAAATGDDAIDTGTDGHGSTPLQAGEGRGTAAARAAAQRHDQASETAERGVLAGAFELPGSAVDETASADATAARAAPEPGFVLPASPEPPAAAAASAAPAAAAPGTAAAAETPVSAAVPVPMDSAEFAEAFGVQVSVLARDGVQQAELHLNPAEMGPVSVQIAMDGERAHIDFGAQAAATRAAIEASLPELAAALRDAGLTLAGGGVSQQTAGRGDDSRQGGSERRGSAPDRGAPVDAASARPQWRGRVSAGGVDLYA